MTTPSISAIVFSAPGEVTTGTFALPEMQADHLLIKTRFSFVSPGTECRVLAGHYGAAGNFPLIPGYCCVGTVEQVGAAVVGYRPGDLVTYTPSCDPGSIPLGISCHWGGQASHHLVRAEMKPVRLPAAADPLQYCFSEVAAISLRGCLLAEPQRGETVIVIGQGPVGAFSAAWFIAAGCRVVVTDRAPNRLERALRNGAAFAVDAREPDHEARLRALCPEGGADIVVETAGISPTVHMAHRLVRSAPGAFRRPRREATARWPRLVMQANYLEPVPTQPHGFVAGEGVLVITPKDRNADDRTEVVESLRRGEIDPSGFIDRVVPWRDAPAQYLALRDNPDSVFSVAIDWT